MIPVLQSFLRILVRIVPALVSFNTIIFFRFLHYLTTSRARVIFLRANFQLIPFKNVRSIIEDKKGNIWLGGDDGLWRYDGSIFTNFTQQFVGYVYEDTNGDIWISSESDRTKSPGWTLSRYTEKWLANHATLPEIITTNEGMIFGILEADNGSIWFGTLNGVIMKRP